VKEAPTLASLKENVLMRVLGLTALFSAAIVLLGAGGGREGAWPAGQAQARQDAMVKLLFASTSLTIERGLIDYQSSPRQLSRVAWSAAPEYEVSYRDVIALLLDETIPPELPCRQHLKATFLKLRQPVDLPPIPHIFRDWEQVRMENPEIVKFITPSGGSEKIDYYQFESDDLRNYRGEKQAFIDAKDVFPDTPSVILVDIIIHPEINMRVRFSSRECFLREGPALTRRIRQFVLSRMRPNP
jgi:hypothetical protein